MTFVPGTVNAYLLDGDPLTLIDTGPALESAYAAVRDGLARSGVGLDDLQRVVITHGHLDHMGLAARLVRESGARVLADPRTVDALVDWRRAWSQRLALIDRASRAGGVPEEVRTTYLDEVAARGTLVEPLCSGDATPVAHREVLQLGGTSWRVIAMPGHTADHIALYHGERGLIGGDVLMRDASTPIPLQPRLPDGGRPDPLSDLITSWRRVGSLAVDTVWPGHGRAIRAPRVLLARRLADAREALRATRQALREGESTIWEVIAQTGLSTSPMRLGHSIGLAVARLDWLVARDRAWRRLDAGVLRYGAPPPGPSGSGDLRGPRRANG